MRRPAYTSIGLALIALAGVAGWLVFGRARPLPDAPLESVPQGAVAVVSVRLRALRAAPAWRTIVGDDADRGMRAAERTCGFDPLSLVSDATAFVTGEEDVGLEHVGFVARGAELQSERLLRCVRSVVEGDGGGVREVRIEGERAIASEHGGGRAAFVRSDGLTGGSEPTVAAVIRTLRGDEPSAATDPLLRELWTRVATGERELTLVARVPEAWRRVLAARLAAQTELAPVTRIVALALSARVAVGVTLGLVLRSASAQDAQLVVRAATAARERALAVPLLRFTPAGRALTQLNLEAQGVDVVAGVDLGAEQARALVDLAREALAPTPPSPRSTPPTPDAIMGPATPTP
jgi:hypothetical protein